MLELGQLSCIQDSELELVLSWRNAPEVRLKMYTTHEISLAEHLTWWQETRQREDKKYLIYKRGGKPFGIVGFTLINKKNSNCSWAFFAAPNAPRGTGSLMEFLAIDHAFRILELNKLNCEVLEFNCQVIKLHKKFGFQLEGILRQNYKRGNDYFDVHQLGILASEWAVKRPLLLKKISILQER